MAQVGGMLTAAVLKIVAEQIGSFIGGEIKLLCNLNDDLEDMRMTLESVLALLKDAARQSIQSATVLLWLKRLKGAAYDISDMIDEFEADTMTKLLAPKCATTICCLTVRPNIKMAKNMKKMRAQLENITKKHKDFNLVSERSSDVHVPYDDKRKTYPNVEAAAVFGRDQDKQTILNYLSNKISTQDFIILAIEGMAGIGKTTLAQLVYNDKQFKEYSTAWVYVSQVFDLNKIVGSIITELSKRVPGLTDFETLPANMNILIVLDDLWETDGFRLDNLKLKLNVGNRAKVIVIVTTRYDGIARRISSFEPYKLEPLTDDMCWNIIKQRSAFEVKDDKERLEQIGREIARKCRGVPLAAQSLGYILLENKRLDEWESIRDSDIWNESASEDLSSPNHVLASLKLSYVRMQPFLKICFGYCAIFPKGQKIVKSDLIHQWISLGFIKPSTVYSTRQLGETYVTKLLGMSFLQCPPNSPSTAGAYHDDATFFTMHDLVHDLARLVMVDEIQDANIQDNTRGSSCRYALHTDCTKPLEKLRALRLMDCNISTRLHDDAFSSAKFLRVLDLSGCSIQRLTNSIGQLKQLRYLNAPGVQHEKIPGCITKLWKLMYLSLRGSSTMLALPECIGEMEGLIYLDLSSCPGIKKLPRSFGELKKLVHLDLSNCSHVSGVSDCLESLTNLEYLNLSGCPNIGELPGALGNLSKLEYLNLSNCSYIEGRSEVEVLRTLTKLEYLNLSSQFYEYLNQAPQFSESLSSFIIPPIEMIPEQLHYRISPSEIKRLPEALSSFMNLKYLNLSGFKKLEELPTSFGDLKGLVYLDLSHCRQVKGVLEALRGLTKLQFLNLSHCSNILENGLHIRMKVESISNLNKLQYLNLSGLLDDKYLGDPTLSLCFFECISTLSNLEHLDLSKNTYLLSLPDCFGCLRKLHTLDLSECTLLQTIPASIGQIDSLKFLHANDCPFLVNSKSNRSSILLPHFPVEANEDGLSSNIVLLQDVNTLSLEITSLENVRALKEVQIIKLMENETVENLKLEWTEDAERFVEDMQVLGDLVPPRTLKEIEIRGYRCANFPAWLMGIAPYLPNLVSITMENFPNCTSLPPLGQLPNLEELTIAEMKSIVKIDGDFCGGPRPFSRLKKCFLRFMENLEVWNTTYSYSGDGVNEFMFPSLCELRISLCPKLWLAPCPPRAKKWVIQESDGVISSWVESVLGTTGASCSLPLVSTLEVESRNVPLREWRLLHHLPNVNHLRMKFCCDLTISEEIVRAISSLQSLALENTSDRQAQLPDWLGELTLLKALEIQSFDMEASQENINHLTSLRKLSLSICKGMTTLPQCVGDLTSLQHLSISLCPDLIELPESLGRLTSLKKLDITYCKSIKSLPTSIEQLTMLEYVLIIACPELKLWCELDDNKRKLAYVKEMRFVDC